YGWARPPRVMRAKWENFERFYNDDVALASKLNEIPQDVYSERGNLRFFRGTHPAVMNETIAGQSWDFDHRIDQQPPDWLRHTLVWTDLCWRRAARFLWRWGQRQKRAWIQGGRTSNPR